LLEDDSLMPDPDPKIVLFAGATGLVGKSALDALLDAPDIARVFAITRRPLGREHPRLANRIVQFDNLETQLKGMTCHVAVCCLGTTIRQAGSQEAFRRVDVDYVLSFARTAKAAQAQRFIVVSSVGANAESKNFYLRTKGAMEDALAAVGFASLDILQPGPLLGLRSQMRPLELGALLVMPLVNPFLRGEREAFRAISAKTVGAAIVGATRSGRKGVQRYTYAGLEALTRLKSVRTVPLVDPKAARQRR
jgi:uncharacterized protein YbjT (DUF2867 family)